MKALVVYESMYGNTHLISTSIADALRTTHEVTLVPVAEATRQLVAEADLLVVGGPTHMHRLSTASSRRMAAEAAAKQASGLTLDPDAACPGSATGSTDSATGTLSPPASIPGSTPGPPSPVAPAAASASC